MRAGFAAKKLPSPVGVEMAGYGYYLGRVAVGVLDDLHVRALCVEDGAQRCVLLSCDLLGVTREIVDAVGHELEARAGVACGRLMIVSTHTHTAPVIKYHEGCGNVDAGYVARLTPVLLDAALSAVEDLHPVSALTFSMSPLAPVYAYNRTEQGGRMDHQVRAFHMARTDAPPIDLISYACHGVCRGRINRASADYPGRVCAIGEEQGVRTLFVNGACGDIDPIPCEDAQREPRMQAFAEAIVTAATRAAREPLPPAMRAGRIPYTLRLMQVTADTIRETAARAAARPGVAPGSDRVAMTWQAETLARLEQGLPASEEIGIAAFCLGGVPVCALPFETFTRTGELIREALADLRALVLGCAEEVLGYLPTREDIERESYAALESAFLYKRLPALSGEAERLGRELGAALRNTMGNARCEKD